MKNKKVRLNKYIASTGFCSRRKADEFILGGKVKVNGDLVLELGILISDKFKSHSGDDLGRCFATIKFQIKIKLQY